MSIFNIQRRTIFDEGTYNFDIKTVGNKSFSNRQVQCSIALGILVVDIGTIFKQKVNRLIIGFPACSDTERRITFWVGLIYIGTMLDEQRYNLRIVGYRCSKQGSQFIGAFLADGVGIRSLLEQRFYDLLVPPTGSLD